MKSLLTFAVLLFSLAVIAQQKKSVVIGAMTEKPNALLIVNPPEGDQGVLLPQLETSQRVNLTPLSPAEDGLLVFDVTVQTFYYWSSGTWVPLGTESPRQTFSTLDPADFKLLMGDGNTRHAAGAMFESDHTFVTVSNPDDGRRLIASADIPHGAVLNEMVVHYVDNDDGDMTVHLERKPLTGGRGELLASWKSTGDTPQVRQQHLNKFNDMEVIDLGNYTYRVLVYFGLDGDENVDRPDEARQRLYGIRFRFRQ